MNERDKNCAKSINFEESKGFWVFHSKKAPLPSSAHSFPLDVFLLLNQQWENMEHFMKVLSILPETMYAYIMLNNNEIKGMDAPTKAHYVLYQAD